jgi:hydroxymethylpyrimidine pyrophosphatase-like HAD family hydrolase
MTDDDVVFAGDSGNDTDALLSGVRSVLVGNAPDTLRSEVRASAENRGLLDRVYFASSHFAAGVVEGLHHFASGTST